jgi:threonine/homoserine/homoserine lactone efflux protein
MKLTAQQIDQLYLFTRQHYVEWYDLQTELVDHLANAIETEWEQNPKLTFDEVLNKEFRKFGVFGFMDVVGSRQAALGKKYNRLVFQHFKAFFRAPKILLTIIMTFLLFIILKHSFYNNFIFIGLYFILIGFAIYGIFKNRIVNKRKDKTNQKKWLFEEIINRYGNFSVAIIFPLNIFIQICNHTEKYLSNEYWVFGMSFFLVLMALLNYIVFIIIPSKTREYLLETYPEYKLENL